MKRRAFLGAAAALALAGPVRANSGADPGAVADIWVRLILQLVRHTATYSPPFASRAFAYLGITMREAARAADPSLPSLSGAFPAMPVLPDLPRGADPAAAMQAALAHAASVHFENTGPSGQRAMAAMRDRLAADLPPGAATDAGLAWGRALSETIAPWAVVDGGIPIANMGFPYDYTLGTGASDWQPTSRIVQQQAPLLPHWGTNRLFGMATPADCPIAPHPEYSESPGSAFRREGEEVMNSVNALTPDQRAVARFWSDDPMLSPTPPGHWISIARNLIAEQAIPVGMATDIYMRLGIALADAMIVCWEAKYRYNLLRPVTYIRRVLDPAWEPILITPPFPEYPSGHSCLSGAAAQVLTAMLGDNVAFTDTTHENEGLPARSFPSFHAAAAEAAVSRIYGGIHFRAACDNGIVQGRLVGDCAMSLDLGR